ncbi:MAG: ATP-dependent Clp protease adaptor ClpS [Bacteroidota bacterium]
MPEHPLEQPDKDDDIGIEEPAKVVLFNDDVHTFEEVIAQIMKAVRCTQTKAEGLAWEAHTAGRAVVFGGSIIRCVEVSGILEEIRLMTHIEM